MTATDADPTLVLHATLIANKRELDAARQDGDAKRIAKALKVFLDNLEKLPTPRQRQGA